MQRITNNPVNKINYAKAHLDFFLQFNRATR